MIATAAHVLIETVIIAGLVVLVVWLIREGLRANNRNIERHVERALTRVEPDEDTDHQLGPSIRAGSAGVRLESRPAAGADLTSALMVRPQKKGRWSRGARGAIDSKPRCDVPDCDCPIARQARDRADVARAYEQWTADR